MHDVAYDKKTGNPMTEYGEEDNWEISSYTKEGAVLEQSDFETNVSHVQRKVRREWYEAKLFERVDELKEITEEKKEDEESSSSSSSEESESDKNEPSQEQSTM